MISKDEMLKKDFIITVDFSVEDKDVFISKDNMTGERYECASLNELLNVIKKYYQDYMVEENRNKINPKEIVR